MSRLGKNLQCTSSVCSLSRCTELKTLDLRYNQFEELPSVVYKLLTLQVLDLSCSEKLKRFGDQLLQLTHLSKLNCSLSKQLVHPPFAVCEQGITAVKKYFEDLQLEGGIELTIVPIAVIGQKFSGKTSIVESLKKGKRILTNRRRYSSHPSCESMNTEDMYEEATKVFCIHDLALPNAELKLIDYGGHEIYHIAYQLMIKERYLPLIVVNLFEFWEIGSTQSPREAARKLCFDWLSHIYHACPGLGPPLLCLTHTDKFDPKQDSQKSGEKLLEMVKELRDEWLDEEKEQHDKPRCVSHLTNEEVFSPEDIFEFSDDENEISNIQKLKLSLDIRCQAFHTTIPQLWQNVSEFVQEYKHAAYIKICEFRSKFADDDIEIILRYMHNTGSIFWFENHEGLKEYIFHQVPEITDMIKVIFDHRSEDQWKKRLSKFIPFRHGDEMISKESYEKMVEDFKVTGVIDTALLTHLLEKESNFPSEVALGLLQCFHIVHGKIFSNRRHAYAIPYFANKILDTSWEIDDGLQLRLDIILGGLSLPFYVYQVLTVAFLNHLLNSCNDFEVARIGATVYESGVSTRLIHDTSERKITIQISTNLESLGKSWKNLLGAGEHIISVLSGVWKACRVTTKIYCLHCLFLNHPSPEWEVDPDWFYPVHTRDSAIYIRSHENAKNFSGVEHVACRNNPTRKPSVPKPLVLPCKYHKLLACSKDS